MKLTQKVKRPMGAHQPAGDHQWKKIDAFWRTAAAFTVMDGGKSKKGNQIQQRMVGAERLAEILPQPDERGAG